MKDIKYIIKRIIIGTGIALAVLFMKQTVFAYEWETDSTSNIPLNNNSISARGYYNYYNPSTSVTYPSNNTGNYHTFSFNASYDSGYASGSHSYIQSKAVSNYYATGYYFTISNYTFEPNTNYVLVFPFGYSLTNNSVTNNLVQNTDYLIDSSNYTTSSNYIDISSVTFASGSTNEVEENSSYSLMGYFKIIFTASESASDVTFYLGNTSTTAFTYSAYKTTSNTNYLYYYTNGCTAYNSSNNNCSTYYRRYYKPFLYSFSGEYFVPDGNSSLADTTSDIKTTIEGIVNGQFSEDLSFPHIFDGSGLSFGDYTFQDLLLLPLNWLKTIFTSDTACTGITLPFPGISNYTFVLPCASSFITLFLGQELFFYIQLMLGCILGFKILYALYKSCMHIFSPDHFIWVDDIF